MADVGRISGLYRYPIKSMLGETLDAASLTQDGIPGDRAWGVRDEMRGNFFTGKRSPELMGCRASYDASGADGEVPRIHLPSGEDFRADDADAADRVAAETGLDVTLWPVVPEARQAEPREEIDGEEAMRTMMARIEGEPMPDFSDPDPALIEIFARGGPFFDAYPLMLLSQRSLDSIAQAAPDARIDVRRFRPSILVETLDDSAFPEQAWIGRRLRIGEAILEIRSTCVRCVMTTHGFADLPKDPGVMRTLVQQADGNLGVYATVETPGTIRREDTLSLLD